MENKKKSKKKPTATGVARAAGVGVGTVSRVINNSPQVRPETAALVRQTMKELGYEPPAPEHRRGPRTGSRRRTSNGGDVMLVIMGDEGLRWVLDCAPIYATVVGGVEAALADSERRLVVRQAKNWHEVHTMLSDVGDVRGLIILGRREPEDTPSARIGKLPNVWAMGSPHRLKGDRVQPDHLQVGVEAAHYLLARKHEHCAFLGRLSGNPASLTSYRAHSFRGTLENAGCQVQMLLDEQLVVVSRGVNAPNEQVLAQLMDQLASAKNRPTGLMLEADMLAPSVYRHLLERDIRPQEDVDIVTCNNERPYLISLHPKPTVVDLCAEAIGRRAVDQLLWRIDHPNEPAVRLLVEPKLIAADAPAG